MKLTYTIIMIVLIFCVLALGFMVYGENVSIEKISGKVIRSDSSNAVENRFLEMANKEPIVKDLPKDAQIEILMYDVDGNGEWVTKKTYITSNKKLKIGNLESPDVIVYVDKKYLEDLDKGFCEIVKEARANNGLEIKKNINSVKLAWKYRGLLKYKSCVE